MPAAVPDQTQPPGTEGTPAPVARRLEQALEALIQTEGRSPGDRLPSERDLAAQLGASRASLREAVRHLVHRGLVEVRRTGIFVASAPVPAPWAEVAIAAPLAPLVAGHTGYGQDVLEVRTALEGTAASLAARRADTAARQRILERLIAMEAREGTSTPEEAAHLDAAFHLAIAEAANNAILMQVMSSLFDLLQRSILQTLQKIYHTPETAQMLARQHRALYAAIAAGDAEGARRLSDDHLAFVAGAVRAVDDDLSRKARADAAHLLDPMRRPGP